MPTPEPVQKSKRPGPQPLNILTKAAAVENVVTQIIAGRVTGDDELGFSLFLTYAADRIPVNERIRMLGDIIDSIADPPPGLYPSLLDDLRLINEVRVHVAHSVHVPAWAASGPARYVKWRRGRQVVLHEDDLREQTRQALKAHKRILKALRSLIEAQRDNPRFDKA